MNRASFLIILLAMTGMASLLAQAPQMFNYQAVLRDDAGQPLVHENVEIYIEILKDGPEGEVMFAESHNTETNALGLINLKIGSQESMENIDWGDGDHFIRLFADGTEMGVSQLLSVPYSLHALQSADSFSGNYDDLENLPDLAAFVKLENPSPGDMLVFVDDDWQPLGLGQEGQVLTVHEGLPVWQDMDAGDDEPLTDIDGNVYETVVIGEQEWKAENLRTTRYNDGTDITYPGSDDSGWYNNSDGAFAWYNNDIANKDIYGALYNWYAVDEASNGGRNICPEGWRVPYESDWQALTNYLINNYEHISQGNVANVLKSCRQVNSPEGGDCDTDEHPRWDTDSNHHGTDEFGFGALPGGRRYMYGDFQMIGEYGHWWTRSESGDWMALFRAMLSYDGGVFESQFFKETGMAVRCVKD